MRLSVSQPPEENAALVANKHAQRGAAADRRGEPPVGGRAAAVAGRDRARLLALFYQRKGKR
jgi:hypothetical protein